MCQFDVDDEDFYEECVSCGDFFIKTYDHEAICEDCESEEEE